MAKTQFFSYYKMKFLWYLSKSTWTREEYNSFSSRFKTRIRGSSRSKISTKICIIYYIPCILYPVPYFDSVPCIYKLSYVLYPESYILNNVFCILYPVSWILYSVSISCTWRVMELLLPLENESGEGWENLWYLDLGVQGSGSALNYLMSE